MIPLPDFEGMSQYVVRLLNNACDTETQAEFNALALVPIVKQVRESRDIAPRWNRWPIEQGDYIS